MATSFESWRALISMTVGAFTNKSDEAHVEVQTLCR
jgi:hypothetical protein